VSTYLVYKPAIKGAGFDHIEIRDDYDDNGLLKIPESVLDEIHMILNDFGKMQVMVDGNFEKGKKEFGYNILSAKLNGLLNSYSDEIRASRRRLQKSRKSYAV